VVTTSGGRRAAADQDFRAALEEERRKNARRLDVLRLGGVSALFLLHVVLGGVLAHGAWRRGLLAFALYWAVTAGAFAASRRREAAARLTSLAIPLVDMPMVFYLALGMASASASAQHVAALTAGVYVFLVFLAALSLDRWRVYLAAGSAALWEGVLLHVVEAARESFAVALALIALAGATGAYASRWLSLLVARVARDGADLRRAQETVHRQEKLAAVGQLAAGVAHDLRNPLWAARNSVIWLRKHLSGDAGAKEPRLEKAIELIDHELRACSSIIDALLDFARERPLEVCLTPLRVLAADALAIVRAPRGVTIQNQVPGDLPDVELDPVQLRQVLVNLAQNAVDALPEDRGGTVRVGAEIEGARIRLTVEDDGVGIPEGNLRRIFEPLFTTRAKGTGLGLAIVSTIVKRHKGTVTVESRPGEGARFVIVMPARQKAEKRSTA
jgi:signal transduction histidine kinase